MLWWLPALAVWTAVLFYLFMYAVTAENDESWWTSEPVQIVTGIGALAGALAVVGIVIVALVRGVRRWLT